MKLLKKLYSIHSPSKKEYKMVSFISDFLARNKIKYKTDKDGNIYRFIKGKPLLSCHQDQVQSKKCLYPFSYKSKGKTIIRGYNKKNKQTGLGADDKNGIWILLKLLTEHHVSFIFSVREEIGGGIDKLLFDNADILESMPYGIIFDRRGKSDIIGEMSDYCCDDFQDNLIKISDKHSFGFSPNIGSFSDADVISEYMACANLSVGYYNPHSDYECTVFDELNNTLKYAKEILRRLNGYRYDLPEKYNNWCQYDKDRIDTLYYADSEIYVDGSGIVLIDNYQEIKLSDIPEILYQDTFFHVNGKTLLMYRDRGYAYAYWLDKNGECGHEISVTEY